jgi:hypothetical protein
VKGLYEIKRIPNSFEFPLHQIGTGCRTRQSVCPFITCSLRCYFAFAGAFAFWIAAHLALLATDILFRADPESVLFVLSVTTGTPDTAVVGPAASSKSRTFTSCGSLLVKLEERRIESAVCSGFKQPQHRFWSYPSARNHFAPGWKPDPISSLLTQVARVDRVFFPVDFFTERGSSKNWMRGGRPILIRSASR